MAKRFLSLLLILATVLALATPAFAAGPETGEAAATAETSNISVEGTTSAGALIAKELEGKLEAPRQDCNITDLAVNGTTATVSYYAGTAATVLVGIYDETTGRMKASGSAAVEADSTTVTVSLEGDMPGSFIAKAYLLDEENVPLCEEFTSELYTQQMQEFLEKTTANYDQEKVLNLDESADTNFMVYSEKTALLEAAGETNKLTDNKNGTYTVTNADETFTGLQAGDVFSYTMEDGSVLLVKVKQVSVDGTTVTITEDTDTQWSDFFDAVKIDLGPASDPGGAATIAEIYDNADEPVTKSVDIDLEKTFKNDIGDIKLSAHGNLTADITVKVYLFEADEEKHDYVEVAVDLSANAHFEVAGQIYRQTMELPGVAFLLLGGIVDISFTPSLVFEASGQAVFDATIAMRFGMRADGDGIHNVSKAPTFNAKFQAEVVVYVGFVLEPAIGIAPAGYVVAQCSLPVEFGVEVTAKSSWEYEVDADVIHECGAACIDGDISAKLTISISGELFSKEIGSLDILPTKTYHLTDFYYSIKYNEFGWTKCPHNTYKVTLIVVDDETDSRVKGAVVEGTHLEPAPVTDDDGAAKFHLPNGSYALTVSQGDKTATETVEVKGKPLALTIRLTESAGPGPDDGSGIVWNFNDANGTLTISGRGKMKDYAQESETPWHEKQSSIKSVIVEDGVTSIGDRAFKDCLYITSISLPTSIQRIGEEALFGTRITSLYLGPSVNELGPGFAANCKKLERITLNEANKNYYVEYGILYSADKTELLLYPGGLGGFSIPEGVKHIAPKACIGYISGTLKLPESLESIGEYAFYGDTFNAPLTLPSGLQTIGEGAFMGCNLTRDLTIPDSVVSIGAYAFRNNAFVNVHIGKGVTSIGDGAFAGQTMLSHDNESKFYVDPANGNFSVDENGAALFGDGGATLIAHRQYLVSGSGGTYTIPGSVTRIGALAFSCNASLTKMILPDGLTSIGYGAFMNCGILQEVEIPAGVESIEDDVFKDCPMLIKLTILSQTCAFGGGWPPDVTDVTAPLGKQDVVKVYGYASSTAESYAEQYGYQFLSVDEVPAEDAAMEEPAMIMEPEVTAEPETTAEPEVTAEPEATVEPEVTAEPEATVEPEETAEPDITAEPEETAEPEATVEPEATIEPEATEAPTGAIDGEPADVVPAAAFTGNVDGEKASFTGLVPGEEYALIVTRTKGSLAGSDLLFIAQAAADGDGKISFAYLPRESGGAMAAYGPANKILQAKDVTIGRTGAVTVTYGGSPLTADTDYTVRYVSESGGYGVVVTGRGDYSGTVSRSFATQITLGQTSYLWDGKAKTPGVTVKLDGETLRQNTDYTVSYADNVEVGMASVKVTGTGAYAGTATVYFAIHNNAPAVSVQAASTGIKVSWDEIGGAGKYRVYYKTSATGGWKKLADTSSTSYTWKKASNNKDYWFSMRCMDSKAKKYLTDYAAAVSFRRLSTPSITLTNKLDGVEVKWSDVKAPKYKVTVNDAESELASGDILTAENNTTYKVTVQAVDASGVPMSAAASKSIKFLSAPVLSGIERVSTGIKLTWGAVTGAAKYRVYYKTETGKWTKLTDTSSTSYTWKKAKTGTKYYFSVACVDSKGKTVTSAKYEDRMDDRLTILAAPSVTLTNTTEGLEVSWKTVPAAKEYKVTVNDTVAASNVTGTSYLYEAAANNTKYTVTVESLGEDTKVIGKASAAKSKTFFDAPEISAVEAVSSGIKLTWNKVDSVSKYRIYYRTSATGSWKKLTDTKGTAVEGTESLTYTWKKASYKTYWFTVAAMSGKSVASAKHEDMGDTITLLKPPSVTLTNQTNGILVKWSDLKAAKYKVTVNGAVVAQDVTGTEYLYTGVTNNTPYTVTVQGLGEDGTGKLGKVSATKSILYLDAPTVTAVEASGSGIKVSWNKVAGAVKYRVYYKTETGKWTKAADTKGTAAEDDENSLTYTWTKAKTGTKYYFSVACIDKNGKKLTSAKHEDKEDDCFTLLAAPSVTVSNQTDGIKISWKRITDAERYIVTVTGSDKAQADQQTIEANGEEQFSYTCPKEYLTSGVKYTVTVQADGSEKTRGKVSAAKSITYLDAPEVTSLEAVSSGIKISWGKVSGASRYRVYYKTEGGSWKTLANTKGTEAGDGILSYTWTKAGTSKYYFTVVCMDSKYKKATSAKYEDTRYEFTLLAAPGVTAVLAKEDGQDAINLSWAAVPGADKYRVSIKKDGAWETLADTAETSYSYTELTSGGSYTFTVWCVDRDGTCVSKYASAGKTVKYYPAPTGIKAQIGLAGLEVSWEDVPGAIPEGATRPKDIKYRVYYKTSPDGAWKKACDTTGCAYAWEPTASGDYWLAVACVDKSGKTVLSAMDETAESVHYLWEIDIPAAEKAIEEHGEDVGFTVGGDPGSWDPCTYYGKSMSGLIATGCEVVDSLRDSITEQGRSPSNMKCTIEKAKDHYVITVYYSFV